MERERRKRKLENNSNDEEENEEEKMEKFFALIKSTKDVRDLLFNKEKKVEEGSEDEKRKSTWTPTFQPEDFIDSGEDQLMGIRRTNVTVSTTPHEAAGPSEKEDLKEAIPAAAASPPPENYEEKEKARDQLDLNLSL